MKIWDDFETWVTQSLPPWAPIASYVLLAAIAIYAVVAAIAQTL